VLITPSLFKLHADYSVVILTAPLAVFIESYRLLRMNTAKELVRAWCTPSVARLLEIFSRTFCRFSYLKFYFMLILS